MKPVFSRPWDVSVQEAYSIQQKLAERVVTENGFEEICSVAGVDVAFGDEEAYGALALYSYPWLEKLGVVVVKEKVKFPYVPGLLSFREGPVILKVFEECKSEPDLILFDAQGVAHPRRFGLASHMGLLFNKPTIGCAKSRLRGEYGHLGRAKGSVTPLRSNGELLGSVVRTREGVKPLFVSPGHLVDFKTSVSIVLQCTGKFRIPEPLRMADLAGRRAKLRQTF